MITANFSGLPSDEALVLSTGLWQYDTGQQLRISGISGLSENTEVHFGLKHTDRAIVKTGVYRDNALTVDIPNRFLEYADGTPAKIWVHIRESESAAKTVRESQIPISERERPDDYISPGDTSGETIIQNVVTAYLDAHPEQYTGYTQAQTSSLLSMKADKADYTSVKDFGAKGDGITNDTAAFNTAIAAKRFIFIPAGTYLIDDITVDKSVLIKGAGTAATYLKANSETSGGSLITIIKNRSSISDMSIHGRNGSNVNHAAITVAPHAGTEPNSIAATVTVTLENLKIQGMAGIGINILDNVEDCVISNVDIESCKSSGMKLWGVGHSISNVTSQKNKGDGIEIRQGGLHMTNVRCWGNEGNGMSMGGVSHAVISNVELQQNQLNGLYMVPVDNSGRRNRMNSIINVTTLGNNYKKVDENDETASALTENTCGFVVSGLYNYVQGFDVLSKFKSGWMACEKYSLLMSQPDDIGNTVDIKTAAGNGIDMYDVMFDSKYSRRRFEEPLKAKIAFNNPFNKIIVDGSAVEPPAMTASVYQSGQDVVHSNVSASVTNNGKSITLSGLTSAGVTVVDFNNFYNHSFPYRQTHKINYTSGTKRVYIRLRARVSDFRKFGIVPGVGQIINQSGTRYRLDSEDLKKNCIFNTDFTTKEYYFEIPDTTVSLGSFLVMLHFVKLTDDEIDEVSFEIDELSAAFLDETPTVIN